MPGTTEPADDAPVEPPRSALDSIGQLLRPELADLVAYVPHDPPGIEVKLDANEAPPVSPTVREVVARAIASVALERYPDPRALRLKEAIAKRTGAKIEDLLVGTGSDEVIGLVSNALAWPRRRNTQGVILTPTPTFVMYRITARAHGLKPVEVPLDASWDLDVAMTKKAIAMMQPSVVFIASPNNPTGNQMSRERLDEIVRASGEKRSGTRTATATATAESARKGSAMAAMMLTATGTEGGEGGAFVIVDEAYVDYSGPGASVRGWRERYPHLGILRTVSKVGLAALRVGWLEADAGLVAEIDKTRQPFNVSATSQIAAAAVLEEAWDEVQAGVARVVAAREKLAAAIDALEGFSVTPSAANFVWVKTPIASEKVHEHLANDGILVRSFHKSGGRLGAQLRITVGDDAQHDRLLASLAKVRPES
ncbi:MAG: Histidinol-phosphate aminotransferase [Myxococcaceae bacterium]|nr:Histidinol-phosphate aminotransferase [Myxococcaceae bacterium]